MSASNNPVSRGPRARPAPARRDPSIACGACAGRIALAEFVFPDVAPAGIVRANGHPMARTADCPSCGETTVIALLRPSA